MVRIDAPCPDCGEPMRVVVRDGHVELAVPADIRGYTDVPLRDWADDWAYT